MMRQHQWARLALARVQDAAKLDAGARNEYRSLCRALPALFRRSGLAQALTYLESRNEGRAAAVLRDLATVYGTTPADLVKRVVSSERVDEYLLLSRDLIAIAGWMRRFVDAVLPAPQAAGDEAEETAPTQEVAPAPSSESIG